MTDALLQTAVTTALGAGFTLSIDRSQGQRVVTLTRTSSGVSYGATHPIDGDDATWTRLIDSLRRNHYANEWVRVNGPWTRAQATLAGWPIFGSMAMATMTNGKTVFVSISG